MAERKITIQVGAETADALRKLTGLGDGMRKFGDAVRQGFGIDLVNRFNSALSRIPQVLGDAIKRGVGFNSTLEDSRLGIAAVLKQFQPEKFANFNDALKEAGSAIDTLKEKALESPATFQQLVAAFQANAGAASAANIELSKQVDLTVLMSQALAGLGIRSEQIIQESRALLTGNINEDAAAARILGITKAQIDAAKAEGRLFEFLSETLSAFAEAAKIGAGSLTTLKSNLQDVFDQTLGALARGVFERLKEGIESVTKAVANPSFKQDLEGIAGRLASFTEAGMGLAAFAVKHAGVITDALTALAGGLALLTAAFVAFKAAGAMQAVLTITSFGAAVTSATGLVGILGAAVAGLTFGRLIGEIDVFGTKFNTRMQASWLIVFGTWGKIKAYLDTVWLWMTDTMTITWEKILLTMKSGLLEAAALINKVPFGPKIDVEGLSADIGKTKGMIEELERWRDLRLQNSMRSNAERLKKEQEALDNALAELYTGAFPQTPKKKKPSDKSEENAPPIPPMTTETIAFLEEINAAWRRATMERLELAEFEHQERVARLDDEVKDNMLHLLSKQRLTAIYEAEKTQIVKEEAEKQVSAITEQQAKLERVYQQGLQETNNLFEVGSIRQIEAIKRNNAAIDEYKAGLIKLLEVLQAMAVTNPNLTGLSDEIARIEETLTRLKGAFQDESFLGTLRRNLRNLADEWSAIGKNMAGVMTSGVGRAVDGVSNSIMGMIDGTQTWGQAFANVARSIIADLIRVVVQWVAQMTIVRALRKIMDVEQVTSAAGRATAEAPAAALASIGSYGAAAAIGIAALLAGVAVGIAAFATGGVVRGAGGPREDRNIIAVSDGEYVVQAAAVEHYGLGFLDAVNAQALGASSAMGASGGGGSVTVAPAPVNVAIINNKAALREYLRSNDGRQVLVDEMTAQKMELGLES